MKRNLFALFLLFFLPFLISAQNVEYSTLYFNNGKLRADSTLSISAEQFKIWWQAEEGIVYTIASKLTYPEVCKRNGVEGNLIVAFDFAGSEIKNIKVLKPSNPHFSEAAINAIQNSAKTIFEVLNSKKYNPKGTYYLPLDFDLIDLRGEVKKRSAVPIIKTVEPIIPASIFGIP